MRIAHLVSHPGLNGVATSVKALIDAQLRAGHEIMLVHPPKSWIEAQTFAAPVTLLQSDFKTLPKTLRKTGYAIRDWGRTLVHAHGSRANKLVMVWRVVDGVPSVMTAHSKQFQIPWLFAHQIVGLSAETVRYYRDRRLAGRNIHDVPNLFDAEALPPASAERRDAAREKLGLRPQSLVLGAVGGICERKRQTDMIRVLRHLTVSGVDAELVLIGGIDDEQPFRREFETERADPALAGRIHLPGKRSDAVELMPAFDLFLCLSRNEEAPIAPLEAMAQAVPVLSTRVGNMPDLLPTDRLFAVGDTPGVAEAASALLGDPGARAHAGAMDRRTVTERLAPSTILPKIDEIYQMAIEAAGARGRRFGARR